MYKKRFYARARKHKEECAEYESERIVDNDYFIRIRILCAKHLENIKYKMCILYIYKDVCV